MSASVIKVVDLEGYVIACLRWKRISFHSRHPDWLAALTDQEKTLLGQREAFIPAVIKLPCVERRFEDFFHPVEVSDNERYVT